jgi:hypothetical protein
MARKSTTEQSDAADESQGTAPSAAVADTSAAQEAAESAGIVGAGATASGLASDTGGETTVVQEAENGIQDGPLADLGDPTESWQGLHG